MKVVIFTTKHVIFEGSLEECQDLMKSIKDVKDKLSSRERKYTIALVTEYGSFQDWLERLELKD